MTPAPAIRRLLLLVAVLLGTAAAIAQQAQPASAAAGAGQALVIEIDGPIGPATADHVARGLEQAAESGARVVVLTIDTPGGLDTSMRRIIRDIVASTVPVIAYVAPGGARAASAGTYIVYASHLAAMAPGTNLGAATPVSIGGPGAPQQRPAAAAPGSATSGAARAEPATASERKALNDAIATIRSLAELRGRNADWAESAVRDAASLPANEALERDVVELVVDDVERLLQRADGRGVVVGGRSVVLRTAGVSTTLFEADWRTRAIGVLANPNVALILMMVGVYGLLFEFLSPGALVPGVVGAISLVLGLYALSVLPLDHAGIALILLGVALLVAEAFAPSFGVLGIGGAIAFVVGAGFLVDTDAPGLSLSLPLAAGVALASLAFSLLVLRLAVKSRRLRPATGTEALVGRAARVLDWSGSSGHVHVDGERWAAGGAVGLVAGQTVRVAAVTGLHVEVAAEPVPPSTRAPAPSSRPSPPSHLSPPSPPETSR